MNLQDTYLQQLVPTIPVPRYESLDWLAESGHRFLVASDGLWLETKRPWLHLVWPVGMANSVAIPYGQVAKRCEVAGGKLPASLMAEFIRFAQQQPDIERAAWIIWDEHMQAYRCRDVKVLHASRDRIQYERPTLADHEHLVVDMHSHANLRAFFSVEDDRDDRGEVKFSFVVGDCHTDQPSTCLRLCANGLFIPVPFGL